MKPTEIEELLRSYGRAVPRERLFRAGTEAALRRRLSGWARREERAAGRGRAGMRLGTRPAVLAGTGLAAAALLVSVLLFWGRGPRTRETDRTAPAPAPTWSAPLAAAEADLAGGRYAKAEGPLRQALAALETPPAPPPLRAGVQRLLAEALQAQGRIEEARLVYLEALGLLGRILRARPAGAGDQEALAAAEGAAGDIAFQKEDFGSAELHYHRFVEFYEALLREHPDQGDLLESLAVGCGKLADVSLRRGDIPAARRQHQRILGILERLAKADPGNPRHLENLATGCTRLGELARTEGDLDRAADLFHRVTVVYETLLGQEPENHRYVEQLSVGYARLADLARARKEPMEAVAWGRLAVGADEQLSRMSPQDPIYREMLLTDLERSGGLCLEAGRLDAAAEDFRRLLELRERFSGPNDVLTARAESRLGTALARGARRTGEKGTSLAAVRASGADERRAGLVEAETRLRHALRVLDRGLERGHPWRREALESLVELYGPDRLDYPRKLADVKSRLRRLRPPRARR